MKTLSNLVILSVIGISSLASAGDAACPGGPPCARLGGVVITATLGDTKYNVDTALTSLPVNPEWRCDIYAAMAESPHVGTIRGFLRCQRDDQTAFVNVTVACVTSGKNSQSQSVELTGDHVVDKLTLACSRRASVLPGK